MGVQKSISAIFYGNANEIFAKSLEILNEEDFYKAAHKKIYKAMAELFEANEEIDVLTLGERLRKIDPDAGAFGSGTGAIGQYHAGRCSGI